jgi:putative ABC transport system permease protein
VLSLVSLANIQTTKAELDTQMKNDSVWKSAENFYAVITNFVTNDIKESRALEKRAYNVYADFTNQLDGILIDANNFREENGLRLCELNAQNGLSIYSLSGKSIIMNENYLERNRISFQGKIIRDPYIINVLAPRSLKNQEETIRAAALDSFYFKKITVANIYYTAFNEHPETIKISDLKTNVIYVDDNKSYFTYDANIEPENYNQIIDPIVYVYTQNFDASEYYAYLNLTLTCITLALSPIPRTLKICVPVLDTALGVTFIHLLTKKSLANMVKSGVLV